jgi:DNA repair exonuclease SbcCD ATPase subunit
MARKSTGTTFNVDQARQQRDQLRDQVRTMDQQNRGLMQGLDNQQRAAVEQRTRSMDQLQEQIKSQLRSMDRELAKTSPDRKRIAELAQNVERDSQRYQQQYREMGDDLSLRSPQS